MKKYLSTALVTPAALASLPALAQTTANRPDYWHDGWDWGLGHMAFGGLMMLLFWGGVVVLIVLAVRWIGGGSASDSGTQTQRKSASEILKERFARGEIDKDEFEERKRLLSD